VKGESKYCCGDAQRYLECVRIEGAWRWRFKLRYWVHDSFACPELFYCPFCGVRVAEHCEPATADMAPVGRRVGSMEAKV
jgi:hypothetical protein